MSDDEVFIAPVGTSPLWSEEWQSVGYIKDGVMSLAFDSAEEAELAIRFDALTNKKWQFELTEVNMDLLKALIENFVKEEES